MWKFDAPEDTPSEDHLPKPTEDRHWSRDAHGPTRPRRYLIDALSLIPGSSFSETQRRDHRIADRRAETDALIMAEPHIAGRPLSAML